MGINNINSKINYFIPSPQEEADKRTSAEFMKQLHGVQRCIH